MYICTYFCTLNHIWTWSILINWCLVRWLQNSEYGIVGLGAGLGLPVRHITAFTFSCEDLSWGKESYREDLGAASLFSLLILSPTGPLIREGLGCRRRVQLCHYQAVGWIACCWNHTVKSFPPTPPQCLRMCSFGGWLYSQKEGEIGR